MGKRKEDSMSLDKYQRIVAGAYEDGLFRQTQSVQSAEDLGDGLFTFLLRELSENEGVDSLREALSRLDTILAEVLVVQQAFERMEGGDMDTIRDSLRDVIGEAIMESSFCSPVLSAERVMEASSLATDAVCWLLGIDDAKQSWPFDETDVEVLLKSRYRKEEEV